jgi:hypothetical protein
LPPEITSSKGLLDPPEALCEITRSYRGIVFNATDWNCEGGSTAPPGDVK